MTSKTSLRALVAEDEPAMLSLNAGFLRQKGFDVTEASDGEQAWTLAEKGGYDLVLLDVMMPGMSGWEVCKRIKAGANTKRTAVVMLTGIGETLNDLTSGLFAADAWLNKPYDFAELERKLREALRTYDKDMPDGGSAFYVREDEPPPSLPSEAGPAIHKTQGHKGAAKGSTKKVTPQKKPLAKAKKAAPKKAAPKKVAKPAAKKPAPKKAAKPAAKKPAPKKAAKPAAKKPAPKKAAKPAAKKPAPKKK